MSHVCDVILVTLLGQNQEHAIEPIQSYLRSHHNGCQLEQVEEHAGGNKHIQAEVWMGAFNYLNIREFLDVFHHMEWENPDRVQLMLKDEHDDRFTVYVPL